MDLLKLKEGWDLARHKAAEYRNKAQEAANSGNHIQAEHYRGIARSWEAEERSLDKQIRNAAILNTIEPEPDDDTDAIDPQPRSAYTRDIHPVDGRYGYEPYVPEDPRDTMGMRPGDEPE